MVGDFGFSGTLGKPSHDGTYIHMIFRSFGAAATAVCGRAGVTPWHLLVRCFGTAATAVFLGRAGVTAMIFREGTR